MTTRTPWLPTLPAHWSSPALAHVAKLESGADFKTVETEPSEDAVPVIGSGGPFAHASRALYSGESVLLGRKGTVDKPLYWDGPFWTVDTMFYTVAGPRILPRFLFYLALTVDYSYFSTNTALPSVSGRDLREMRIPLPPLEEQRRIAEFLDRETAQIDELIAKQEELISTLAERLQSRVELLMTGADGTSIDAVETGVEWWPRLPADWGVPKVTHHFEVVLGKMLDGGREPVRGEMSIPYIRAANIQESELRLDDVNAMPMTAAEAARLDLRAGDLLVVEGGAVGVNQFLREDLPGISFQKTVNRVRPRGPGSSEYLGVVLDVLRWRGVIDMICNRSTIAHFTAEKLAGLRVPWPPVARQFEIAREVRALREDVSVLTARALSAIDLLRERRQALISATVTGQIDVGGAS